jgi:paired amphipathic helix protein Sin3a
MFATIQILRRDDSTFDMDDLTAEAKWSYYVSSYTIRDPTEGVPMHMLRMPFLKRNMPQRSESEDEYNAKYLPLQHYDNMIIRICTNSYHMLYEPSSMDWFCHGKYIRGAVSEEKKKVIHENRKSKFNDKFVMNAAWMKDQSREFVDGVKEEYRKWVEKGRENGDAAASADKDAVDEAIVDEAVVDEAVVDEAVPDEAMADVQ